MFAVSWMMDANQGLLLLTGANHSFVVCQMLGLLIQENYSLYRSYHFRAYTAICCGEVFSVARPSAFAELMMEYLGLAILQYLVTQVHFQVDVSLSDDDRDTFSTYSIRRLRYRHQRGQDEDWVFQFDDDAFMPGTASSVFQQDIFLGIVGKLEVEAILMPQSVEFTAVEDDLRYDNRDGLSESLIVDVGRRARFRGRNDQTLYMEAFRGMLYQNETTLAAENLVNQEAIIIQETLMACVHRGRLTYWPQLHRTDGVNEKLKVWRLAPPDQNGGQQAINYFAHLDDLFYDSMRRRFTNHDIIDIGAYENMGRDFDTLARAWQTRQIANHFFSMSKRYPGKVNILERV